MQSLTLGKGTVTFCINDDPERVISFNPGDARLYERVIHFYNEIKIKQQEFEQRAINEADPEDKDENGVPLEIAKSAALMRETADWICKQLDDVFGAGTSKKVFKETFTFEDFITFMEFVLSFFNQESQERVTKRLKKQTGKVMM